MNKARTFGAGAGMVAIGAAAWLAVTSGSHPAAPAPAVSTTISAEDLRRYGIRSLDEAINYLSLGMITENPLHSVDIGARGVLLTADFGNHVLLLIDGHVVNEQWDGTAYFERGRFSEIWSASFPAVSSTTVGL